MLPDAQVVAPEQVLPSPDVPAKHFLFDVLTAAGHVTPTLPLVAELVRRGHRVDYATGQDHAAAVRAAGAHWVPLPTFPPFESSDLSADAFKRFLRHYFDAQRATYSVLLAHCAAQRPDVICRDATNWPGRLVAVRLGIPDACTFPHLASNEHFSMAARMAAGVGGGDPVTDALGGPCEEFSAEHGMSLTPHELQDVPAGLNLAFYPREFQPHGDTFDERFAFVGPQIGAGERSDSWEPSDSNAPLLYVAFGSFFTDQVAFYRTCVEAFGASGWQVAMSTGPMRKEELGPLPSTVEARPGFPQLSVLRHARAFVSHAGMNSTMEAMYHGVPLVTVPQMPEQEVNADRITELGLGARLDTTALTTDQLRTTVEDTATDTSTRARMDAMSDAARAAGGTQRAADELLAYTP